MEKGKVRPRQKPASKPDSPAGIQRWTVCKYCQVDIDLAVDDVRWGRWKVRGATYIGYVHPDCAPETAVV